MAASNKTGSSDNNNNPQQQNDDPTLTITWRRQQQQHAGNNNNKATTTVQWRRPQSELDEILVQSIAAQNLDVAKRALQLGAARREEALLTAVCQANTAAVDFLLDSGLLNINATSPSTGLTALHHAVIMGHVPIVRLLLYKGRANVNGTANNNSNSSSSSSFYTPLQCCLLAPHPNLAVLRLLLERGADASIMVKGNIPLLCIVPDRVATHAVPLLIQAGANAMTTTPVTAGGFTALHTASGNGQVQKLKALLEAAKSTSSTTPDLLLHHVDNQGDTALHWAAAAGQLSAVQWLVHQDTALVNTRNQHFQTPLDVACAKKQTTTALFLLNRTMTAVVPKASLQQGIDDSWGYTSLHWLCESDEDRSPYTYDDETLCQVAQALVDTDVEINRQEMTTTQMVHGISQLGETPLHLASRWSAPLCRWLLEQGADPFATDIHWNRNALLMATSEGTVETVSCILNNMLSTSRLDLLNQTDKDGWTALHYAAFRQHVGILRMLAQHGAKVDAPNAHGRQPLHLVGARRNHHIISIGLPSHDQEISRILDCGYEPPAEVSSNDDSMSTTLECTTILVHSGASARATDKRKDLPFFLLATTEQLDSCFVLIRAAAGQGLFDGNAVRRSLYTN